MLPTDRETELTRRYWQITAMAAELMKGGMTVFSPITAFHPVGVDFGVTRSEQWWVNHCLNMLSGADAMFVFQMAGVAGL